MRVPSQTPFSSFAWILQLLSVHLVIEAPFTPCLILHFTGVCPSEVSGALETACGIWNTIRWDAARNCAATVVLPLPFPPSLPHPPGAYSRWGGVCKPSCCRLDCIVPLLTLSLWLQVWNDHLHGMLVTYISAVGSPDLSANLTLLPNTRVSSGKIFNL